MNTLPFTYECARKQGDLEKLSYPSLVDCGNCMAKVINAQGKDMGGEKECQACFGHISKGLEGDKSVGQKQMTSLIGCCAEGIQTQLKKQKENNPLKKEEPAIKQENTSLKREEPILKREKPPKEMVERVRGLPNPEEEFDEFHHEIRLPRMR